METSKLLSLLHRRIISLSQSDRSFSSLPSDQRSYTYDEILSLSDKMTVLYMDKLRNPSFNVPNVKNIEH